MWKISDFQFEFGTKETFEEIKNKLSGLSCLLRDKKFKQSKGKHCTVAQKKMILTAVIGGRLFYVKIFVCCFDISLY